MRDWNGWYSQWDKGFSVGMVLLGTVVVVCAAIGWPLGSLSRAAVSIAGVLWSVGWLTALYRSVPEHTPADRITTLRLGFGSGAVLLLVAAELIPFVEPTDPGYRTLFVLFLLLAVLSDFFDGRVARRTAPSRFGGDWDMQNDAAFAMLLSIAAVVFVGFDSWVILIGLARYLYVIAVPSAHEKVQTPRSYELYGKAVCAVTVISLAAAVADGDTGSALTAALAVSLAAVVSSFGWFTYLLKRERVAGTYITPGTHGSKRISTID